MSHVTICSVGTSRPKAWFVDLGKRAKAFNFGVTMRPGNSRSQEYAWQRVPEVIP